jgi:hypothetical protein
MALFAFNSSNIKANSQESLLVYNSATQNYYFKSQTRYANQPLETKMVTLQAILAK